MRNLLLFTAVASLSFGVAHAKSFNGPYAGLTAGYNSGQIEGSLDLTPLALGTGSAEEDTDGFEGGLYAGYRHNFENNFVLGIEAGALLSNSDGSFTNVVFAGDELEIEKKNELYLSVKPGYSFKDNMLAYLIGGYQVAKFDSTYTVGANTASGDDTFDGFHLGFGGEYAANDRVSLRLEYKHQWYGDQSYTTAGVGTETYEGDENTFRVGVTYNF
ncbi:outer membrane protein [Phaeobacter sp. 22II1-1F12B]|uniref:outer membrane protein n=1 Tax=Phaeobacter sp. 22II1-1F12B TaxID=1317111 RepID=UPI000B521E68|nr:outer membrane beta-barrel protein [Phaeobacter sp. 22II1-1F12B]OWU69955.1 hypothetical protein ATO1_24310 [Phaeobacter sp. 22II1-1F12B]